MTQRAVSKERSIALVLGAALVWYAFGPGAVGLLAVLHIEMLTAIDHYLDRKQENQS